MASIAEICDKGTCSLFTKNGGCVIRNPQGEFAKWLEAQADIAARFERTGNVYTMPMWIRNPSAARPNGKSNGEGVDVVMPRAEYERLLEMTGTRKQVFHRLGR